jgi:hypothetical protein
MATPPKKTSDDQLSLDHKASLRRVGFVTIFPGSRRLRPAHCPGCPCHASGSWSAACNRKPKPLPAPQPCRSPTIIIIITIPTVEVWAPHDDDDDDDDDQPDDDGVLVEESRAATATALAVGRAFGLVQGQLGTGYTQFTPRRVCTGGPSRPVVGSGLFALIALQGIYSMWLLVECQRYIRCVPSLSTMTSLTTTTRGDDDPEEDKEPPPHHDVLH